MTPIKLDVAKREAEWFLDKLVARKMAPSAGEV